MTKTARKRVVVCGAGGFIGSHMVKRLKSRGHWVQGVDRKYPEYGETKADEFTIGDLRDFYFVKDLFRRVDEVYNFAAEMGGAGYVFTGKNDADILHNSALININICESLRDFEGKVFYSSSVCVYPDGVRGIESDAYPANPPSNYGFEKLFSERLYLSYYEKYGLDVRIARFHNTFGPYGTYKGGREKVPAAICRKVAESGGTVEVWGDGEQVRPFIYIEDLLDGIEALMNTKGFTGPVNLGPSDEGAVTINRLIEIVSEIAGRDLVLQYVNGPTGERVRHANNDLARSRLQWAPSRDLKESLAETYSWVSKQV
jgi:nucleoside-diphosphate-sugar epimerase